MTISFPGGVAVEAEFKGNTVRTDQPAPLGAASAMSPFDLFLPSTKRVSTMTIALQLPEGFPEKYNEAIHRAIDHCAVKRALSEPPEFVFKLQTVTA